MKWVFREVPKQVETRLVIEKESFDDEIHHLVTYLEDYEQSQKDSLTVKVEGGLVLIKISDLLALDVQGDYVSLSTRDQTYSVRTRLYQLKEKLPQQSFVQVSRQTIINIDHLRRMEASFSGNMLAILSNGSKVSVSRRYVKALEKQLGL